jgi:hypothetical protein
MQLNFEQKVCFLKKILKFFYVSVSHFIQVFYWNSVQPLTFQKISFIDYGMLRNNNYFFYSESTPGAK